VADGWCWFVLREGHWWLVAGGWFVVREKYCWLVADKPSEQGARLEIDKEHMHAPSRCVAVAIDQFSEFCKHCMLLANSEHSLSSSIDF
jgi:hypothetical protein